MEVVAFLRGVNVGGHRRFRPSLLPAQLAQYDVVNVGATGLLVARRVGSRATFLADLRSALPFSTGIAVCSGRALLEFIGRDPFARENEQPDIVRFVSVAIAGRSKLRKPMPIDLPAMGDWYVRICGNDGPFFFGVYRRHIKTIGHLGRIDAAVETEVTTRKWSTILTAAHILTH